MTDTSRQEGQDTTQRGRQELHEKRPEKVLTKLFSLGRRTSHDTLNDTEPMLHGQSCLVTGASRGIGEQIALEFAKRGASLVLAAQDDDRLKRVAEKCREVGAQSCHSYSVNLLLREEVEKLANEVLRNHGHINVLVNNAGIATQSGLTALNGDPFEWEQMTNLNLVTPMHLTRKFAPSMVERGYGVIINIGSLAGLDAVGTMGAYCATKWGLRGWSLSLHNQLKEYGIKVSLLNPAGTLTEFAKEFSNTIPERFLVPADIAEACLLPFRTSVNCVPSEITLRFAKIPYKRR
eukprot:g7804.t1